MKTLALALSLLCALALSACGVQHDNADALPLGTHKVSVRPYCMSKQIHNDADGKTFNLTCGDTKVTIRNEELVVNGKSYGTLSAGDAVHVEGEKVFVNDKQTEEARK